ncbi:MAG TPA: repressor LexA [Clostridia bacterium]|nr:repressor LexA [Clostridia bacterium]
MGIKKALSQKQRAVLDFLKNWHTQHPYPPSVREIQQGLGIKSTATVHWYLSKLQEKGYIRKDATKPRTIEILEGTRRARGVSIPIIGRVRAGQPLLADENIEGTMTLDADLIPNAEETFMLRVEGDSMIGAGILDGDYVVVRRQANALDGDIVVALLDDEATVKRYYRDASHIILKPENPEFQPIRTTEASIIGKVIGVFRKLT